jgi:hypothetical protein
MHFDCDLQKVQIVASTWTWVWHLTHHDKQPISISNLGKQTMDFGSVEVETEKGCEFN